LSNYEDLLAAPLQFSLLELLRAQLEKIVVFEAGEEGWLIGMRMRRSDSVGVVGESLEEL
jgi:hypothetical protein